MHAEVDLFGRHGDVAGYVAIAVVGAVLGQFGVCTAQLDGAGQLFQGWHGVCLGGDAVISCSVRSARKIV